MDNLTQTALFYTSYNNDFENFSTVQFPDFFLLRRLVNTSPDLNTVAQRHNETGRLQHFILKDKTHFLTHNHRGLTGPALSCSVVLTPEGMWQYGSQYFLLRLQRTGIAKEIKILSHSHTVAVTILPVFVCQIRAGGTDMMLIRAGVNV